MVRLALVIHDVRSAHNVGSLLRTADGLGVEKVYISGISPYPVTQNDSRLPHIAERVSRQIHKTALGAEDFLDITYSNDINKCFEELAKNGFKPVALEQTQSAIQLQDYKPSGSIALVVGNEVSGIDNASLKKIKTHIKIPMSGKKESFNVAAAAAIALYQLRYAP